MEKAKTHAELIAYRNGYTAAVKNFVKKRDALTGWVVLDEGMLPVYCAGWPGACHEYINDAINEHDINTAAKWSVREMVIFQFATPNASAERRDEGASGSS
jgi:hypothetical protein